MIKSPHFVQITPLEIFQAKLSQNQDASGLLKSDTLWSTLSNAVLKLRNKSSKSAVKLNNVNIIRLENAITVKHETIAIIKKSIIKPEKANTANKKANQNITSETSQTMKHIRKAKD